MINLVCEQNLVGFLSAVYAAYYEQPLANGVVSSAHQRNFLDEYIEVPEDVEKARKVKAGIKKKGGTSFYLSVSDAYRSCDPSKEQIIFEYLKLFFKSGTAVVDMFDRPEVVAFNDILNKVCFEIHRMHQFVRFQEMSNGVFYGYYTSDNDILERVMPHFVQTYNIQAFILHDYKRRKMAVYDGDKTYFMLAPEQVDIELSEREIMFQSLWKQYHTNVSIKDREKLRLQTQWLPKKYRHFMNEF